jgi:hypothetical protein
LQENDALPVGETVEPQIKKGRIQQEDAANIQLSYARQKEEEAVFNEEGELVDPDGFDLMSSCGFFVTHSYRDVGRKKCHFCLSFCSVLIVVWAALIINTVVEKGPIIFLKLAEGEAG